MTTTNLILSDVMESDREFRARIINVYGMWGAFCTAVLESHGRHLDDCGKHVGLTRLVTPPAGDS